MSQPSLFGESSFHVDLSREPGNGAFFGEDVLQGLVDGIEDFLHERQPRWERRSHRAGTSVLLGCSPWVNDQALLDAIETLSGACIVISKAPQSADERRAFAALEEINERTSGVELRALSTLGDMAPKVDGKPRMIGPYDGSIDGGFVLPTFRTVGSRRGSRSRARPPFAHAKLALLGRIRWTDEHPAGGVDDYVWFSPRRLWVSSANFTYGSRRSAEFGYWTEDPDLLRGVALVLGGAHRCLGGPQVSGGRPRPGMRACRVRRPSDGGGGRGVRQRGLRGPRAVARHRQSTAYDARRSDRVPL